MSWEYITHHFLCECREEKIQKLCKIFLHEHSEMKNFISGFGVKEPCECEGCKIARELLREEK